MSIYKSSFEKNFVIVVCDDCDGAGLQCGKILMSPYSGHVIEKITCNTCNGSGRLMLVNVIDNKVLPYEKEKVPETHLKKSSES